MSRTLDAETVVKPVKFAHFVLRVRNLEESISWYETLLGMEMVHRGERIAFMSYDDEHHRLALAETAVESEIVPGAPGLDHVAYTLSSLGDLLATYKRLKTKGILPALPINHGLTTSMYYQDPDGCRVEFQVENFETPEELMGYMKTEAFEKNPLGVPYDPEKLVERYERGDPLEELHRIGAA